MADEHRHTNNAVCPYCGVVDRDSWEHNFGPGLEGDGEVTCGSCGEEFLCSRHVSVTYSTKPIAGMALPRSERTPAREEAGVPAVDPTEALRKAEKALAFALEVVCSYEEGGECSESGEFIKADLADVRAAHGLPAVDSQTNPDGADHG